jgi:hypothetical protein
MHHFRQMTTDKLKIGEIYRTEWDERPFRVIGYDDIEVFYDCLSPHDNSWAFSGNFKNKCYYYRTSAPFFIAKSKPIDFSPITEEEQKAFRPELPMRVCRSKALNWNNFNASSFDDFNRLPEIFTDTIQTDKLVLIPYGNKGGFKKGTVIAANNSKFFEASELIWKAKELQEAVNNQISNGIGIYRIGFENELPSYYVGEYLDKAGLIKE